jgi:hypothetical protein
MNLKNCATVRHVKGKLEERVKEAECSGNTMYSYMKMEK